MLVALTVSVIAAYYSIVGLTAIFAAAAIPIIIMGAALEIAKITTAIWLHVNWHSAPLLMKTYLTSATVILMLITSMGIFGFLSKAHIEQSATGIDATAQIERSIKDIDRQESIIERANNKIDSLDARDETQDTGIQDKIEDQQKIINQITTRLEQNVATQTQLISQELSAQSPLRDELELIRHDRERLQAAIESNDVRTLQTMVRATVDGVYGPQTAARVAAYQDQLLEQQRGIADGLERLQASNSAVVVQAQQEIQRLQTVANDEIQRANDAVNQFRNQLLTLTAKDNTLDIEEQESLIDAANDEIDVILLAKFELESSIRQLEIEVGPVKYIAELVYGDASPDLLEEAVRWVIIVLVLVFDPLAIVLVLAGISTFKQEEDATDSTNESTSKVTIDTEEPDVIIDTEEPDVISDTELRTPAIKKVAGDTATLAGHRVK